MNDNSAPYVTIEPAKTKSGNCDICYLVYGRERLEVSHTEYALLLGLIGDGLDFEDASEQRIGLEREGTRGVRKLNPVISDDVGTYILTRLRKKVEDKFPDLKIPQRKHSGGTATVKLYTQTEINHIHNQITNPENATYVISDEQGYRYLVVDGQKISFSGKLFITQQQLALFCILLWGPKPLNVKSELFQDAWRQLTSHNRPDRPHLSVLVAKLKRGLQPAGWTINKSMAGSSAGVYYQLSRLER